MTEREKIQQMLRDNIGTIKQNMVEFFSRHADDLIAVGVSEGELSDAMLSAGVALLIQHHERDLGGAVGELHRLARVVQRLDETIRGPSQQRH